MNKDAYQIKKQQQKNLLFMVCIAKFEFSLVTLENGSLDLIFLFE